MCLTIILQVHVNNMCWFFKIVEFMIVSAVSETALRLEMCILLQDFKSVIINIKFTRFCTEFKCINSYLGY